MDDLELALDLVCRLGEELARGLLAQDESLSIGGGELVGWIRLAETELQNAVNKSAGVSAVTLMENGNAPVSHPAAS